MTDGKLKSLFDRINRLLDEKAALTADIADVFQEVKSAGYIPKVLRTVIRRARADQSKLAEEDAIQELYESALTGRQRKAVEMAASGATAREIEQETGMDQATVARSVSLKRKRETKSNHNAATVSHETAEQPEVDFDQRAQSIIDKAEGALAEAGFVRELGTNNFSKTLKADAAAEAPIEDDTLEPQPFLKRHRERAPA